MTKEQRLSAIHSEALREFDTIISAVRTEREQCLKDRRFYSIPGAQWEDLQEQFANRPRFEVNKTHLALIKIFSEYRNNRITVDFVSKDGRNADDLADTCDGLYRATEQDSVAEEAYDNAFEEAAAGGMGAWRLRAVYEDDEDDDNDRQSIRIEPIFDADSCVFFDLGARRQDKADATRCFVLTPLSYADYTERYGSAPAGWSKDIDASEFDWVTNDVVYVAEYYRVEMQSRYVRKYQLLDGSTEKYSQTDFEADDDLESMLDATGAKLISEKRTRRRRVHKYTLSGERVLEDLGLIAGPNIPIVPAYGKRWIVDGIERCMGHVRLVKDTQRLKNIQVSQTVSISMLSGTSKPILDPEQVQGFEEEWRNDNIMNYPYLRLNSLTDAEGNPVQSGPLGYTKAPEIPPALAVLLQTTDADLRDLLGNQDQGEQIRSNLSGDAVELIQSRLDLQTYIYMSNFAKSVQRSGEIWLGMARELYVEEGRALKTVGKQGEIGTAILQQPVSAENGEVEYENDLSRARFDIAVEVGPTSSSKRRATVRALTNMVQLTQDPETQQILASTAVMNMEGEGLSEIREYFRKRLVRMQVVKPTDEDLLELQNAAQSVKPDANEIYLQAAASAEQARALKAQADAELAVAKAKETEAKTVETLAGVNRDDQQAAIKTAEAIRNAVSTSPQLPG